MCFWNNFNQFISISKHGKPNKLRAFGINTPKGLNRIDKIGYGRLYMREDNLCITDGLIYCNVSPNI